MKQCPKRGTLTYTFLEMKRKSRMNAIIHLTHIIDYYQTYITTVENHELDINLVFEKQFLKDCKKAQDKLWDDQRDIKCF